MNNSRKYKIHIYIIALVWLINGLFCKVLNFVPRHEAIVGRILGEEHASVCTILIGIAEIGMTIWILSGYKTRLNAIVQIVIIATMNTIEFLVVPDLLLWGKANILFASLFISFIYYTAFILKSKSIPQE
ncbi:DoxX-like family protein [Flavobacterium sp. '19STA2R22 D10 B1']|uniref:DoxX-like family protein n=1 Tax=Flavobacterium aerium TaxID=3037261 RepID=UPI00278C4CC0|nr:DoxX-like family protein [Flavobacterium sp. '19STA2R22 D10 B1']